MLKRLQRWHNMLRKKNLQERTKKMKKLTIKCSNKFQKRNTRQ